MRFIAPCREKNYIAFGKYKNTFERIKRWCQGNMSFIDNNIINEICELIDTNMVNLVFIEDSVFGNLVKAIKEKCTDVRVVSFFHDVKADLYPQWRKKETKLWLKIDPTIGIEQEKVSQKTRMLISYLTKEMQRCMKDSTEKDLKQFYLYRHQFQLFQMVS